MNVIEVDHLQHDFGTLRALDGLSFSVQEGEVFGVLGPNGAGKTTSVRILNGVLKPASGKVRTLGLDPRRRAASCASARACSPRLPRRTSG
jgi:ABC-2 type transport system ATP-binding protein